MMFGYVSASLEAATFIFDPGYLGCRLRLHWGSGKARLYSFR
jgi:hypothetical protein